MTRQAAAAVPRPEPGAEARLRRRRPEAAPISIDTDPRRDDAPTARGEWWLRLGVVALCLGAVVAALLLHPVAPRAGAHLSIDGVPLPGVCAFREATGIPCPGCGLTRSWVALLHGDLAWSLRFHPLGWLVFLYALAQATRHGVWLTLGRLRRRIERVGWFLDRGIIALGALLLVAWIPTLVKGLERLWG